MPARRRTTRLIVALIAAFAGYAVSISSTPPASAAPDATPQVVPKPV